MTSFTHSGSGLGILGTNGDEVVAAIAWDRADDDSIVVPADDGLAL